MYDREYERPGVNLNKSRSIAIKKEVEQVNLSDMLGRR